MQTQKSPNDPHIRIWECGCKFHHYQPIPHFKILLDINFYWNRRPLTIWRPPMDINFWIQNGHHSKPTMDINSQHHNLLGNQISPKSEDFCIWRPFCTLVTMATAAILNLSTPQKLPHTTVDIPTKFHEVWWKESKMFLNSPFFCFHGNCGKVCPTDSDFFGLSRSTRCGCCSYQVSSIFVQRVTFYDHFCVFHFFSILAVSMATAAIFKIPKVVCTSTHSA